MSQPVKPGGLPSSSAFPASSAVPGKKVSASGIDRSTVTPQELKAAKEFESMFMDFMLQTMRKTVPENEMSLNNQATKIYQGMLDSEMAQKAADTGGVGLADQIIDYWASTRYNKYTGGPPSGRAEMVRQAGTGGTDENRKSAERSD